nr:hypothetical protein Iba_chr07dCG5800 [Ipomoea batatas]
MNTNPIRSLSKRAKQLHQGLSATLKPRTENLVCHWYRRVQILDAASVMAVHTLLVENKRDQVVLAWVEHDLLVEEESLQLAQEQQVVDQQLIVERQYSAVKGTGCDKPGAETGLTDGGKVGCVLQMNFVEVALGAIENVGKGAAVDGAYDVDIGGGLAASLAIPGAIGLKPEGAVLGGAAKGVEAGLIGKFG